MAKIVITNQPRTANSRSTNSSTCRQVHFLDVWGDLPPTGKAAGLSIATLPDSVSPEPVGPANPRSNSRFGSVKSALAYWGLLAV